MNIQHLSVLCIAALTLQTPSIAGEMYPATLTYTNGATKEVSLEFPLASNADEIIVSVIKGKEEHVASELLTSIDFQTPNGKDYHLQRIFVRTFGKKHKQTYKSVNMIWAYRLRTNPKMDYYAIGSEYRIRKKEKDMEVISKGAIGQVMHCFIRPGEDGATSVHSSTGGGVMVGKEKYFLNSLAAYFSDSPSLVKRLEVGEFEEESLVTLYEAYCNL